MTTLHDADEAYFRCSNCGDEAGVTLGCEGCMEFLGEQPVFQAMTEAFSDILDGEWDCRVDPEHGPMIQIPLATWNEWSKRTW